MKRVHWEERVKQVIEDMNDLHVETEAAIGALIQSISGGNDTLLFDDLPPSVVHTAPNIVFSIPAQWFSVQGIPGSIASPSPSPTKPDTPDQHKIWFVLGRNLITGTRDRVTVSPLSVAPAVVRTREESYGRIEITSSGNPLNPPSPPTLGPNDIGYILYATVVWTGTVLTVTHNIGAVYSFPGAGFTYTNHAAKHLPVGYGGTDPIQLAALGGDPLGSVPGLMPSGSYATLMGALQSLSISALSPYLVKTISGDNSPGSPKAAELRLKIHDSLSIIDISGEKFLGASLRSGGRAGISSFLARYDHTHGPADLPIVLAQETLSVGPTDLGVIRPASSAIRFDLSLVHHVQALWAPPGVSSPPAPLVPCDVMGVITTPSTLTGVRIIPISRNEVKLEIMPGGFVFLSTALYDYLVTLVGGSPTWSFVSDPRYPTDGELFIRAIGAK